MDAHEQATAHIASASRDGNLQAVTTASAPRTVYVLFGKPVIDRLVGVALSVVTVPLAVGISVAIWSTMGRPALFVQQRVGRGGRAFRMYKFRTMVPDRRSMSMPITMNDRRLSHKTRDDPRITRLGRFLRRWSLDEIPQLWNVAFGHMSLVGPRPEIMTIVDGYEPWQHERHSVKPGISGLWQVSARGDVPLHEATELDIEYVRSVSFMQDFKILILTIPAVLGMRRGF